MRDSSKPHVPFPSTAAAAAAAAAAATAADTDWRRELIAATDGRRDEAADAEGEASERADAEAVRVISPGAATTGQKSDRQTRKRSKHAEIQ